MINNRELINEIKGYYVALANEKKFIESMREETLLENAEYYRVATEISTLVFDVQKAKFDGQNDLADKLGKDLETATIHRDKLLKKMGYDSYEIPPTCPYCNDTGYTENDFCHCFYERLTALCYKELGVTEKPLADFADDKFSKLNENGKLFEKLKLYANGFTLGKKNLIFTGKAGTGKSFLAECIVSEISKQNFNALFLTTYDLNKIFVDNMYANESRKRVVNDIFCTCDFLVIDDLGSERVINKITAENLLMIITERLNDKKPFLITTNHDLGEIALKYGDRLFSRISGKQTVPLQFNGQDLRKL